MDSRWHSHGRGKEQARGAGGSRTHNWDVSGLELQGARRMRVTGSGWGRWPPDWARAVEGVVLVGGVGFIPAMPRGVAQAKLGRSSRERGCGSSPIDSG